MHQPIQLVRKIYYLMLAVIGVPVVVCSASLCTVNVLAIVVLSQGKCGLSPCITLYLVAMAAADLLAIITDVILHRINDYYFPLNFLSITPVCSVRYVLLRAAIDCSVWFTVSFTFDRFGAICYQKLKTRYCTKKTAAVVLSTTGTLLCLKNIPIYFRFKPKVIVDNVPLFCSNKRSYFTDPRWIGFRRFEKVLTPLIPFGLILFLNILTVKHIFKVSRIRKGLKCQNKALDHSDPEMGNRRKSVILLFSISGSFILLWLVYILYIFNVSSYLDEYSFYIFENVAYMLRNLSCCTNTFIYVVTQAKFREQLKSSLRATNGDKTVKSKGDSKPDRAICDRTAEGRANRANRGNVQEIQREKVLIVSKVAKQMKWPVTMRVSLIQVTLVGGAGEVFASLSGEVSGEYQVIKKPSSVYMSSTQKLLGILEPKEGPGVTEFERIKQRPTGTLGCLYDCLSLLVSRLPLPEAHTEEENLGSHRKTHGETKHSRPQLYLHQDSRCLRPAPATTPTTFRHLTKRPIVKAYPPPGHDYRGLQ
ncbi:probable G-protein coupled receptor 139 [Chiloscyllium punctatum]|uniref:probable G-protein coupled receptor 139 n=1 Tax=Chiloscyllium punctatum TaxID=137246 RepID=UPI003B63F02E